MELIVRHGEREEAVHLERADGGYRVTVGERAYRVDVAAIGPDTKSLLVDGRQVEVAARRGRDGRFHITGAGRTPPVEVMDPLTHLARQASGETAGAGGTVLAMMPGRVVQVLAAEGDEVTAGQGIVVLEAMKMENEIQAETTGTLQTLHVREGQAVEGGDPLFEVG